MLSILRNYDLLDKIFLLFLFQLLCALDPKLLRLTPKDNDIYEEFKKEFPDFDTSKLSEEALKSSAAKEVS